VSHPKTNQRRPAGHVLAPAGAIAGLSIALAAGLRLLGILDRANAAIATLVSRGGAETFPKRLPEGSLWAATAILSFGLAAAILATPGKWRRVILWASAAILVAAWAPVLSLAAHAPDIAAPWIATFWSGVCAIVYAANHRMACDSPPRLSHETR
jgi:hypothetical protein